LWLREELARSDGPDGLRLRWRSAGPGGCARVRFWGCSPPGDGDGWGRGVAVDLARAQDSRGDRRAARPRASLLGVLAALVLGVGPHFGQRRADRAPSRARRGLVRDRESA